MKLENMLKAVNAQQIIGDTNLEVNGIHMDSRMVKNGFMFVAVKERKLTDITIFPKPLRMDPQ